MASAENVHTDTMQYTEWMETFQKVIMAIEIPAILFVVLSNICVLVLIKKMHSMKLCPHNVLYVVSLTVANLSAGVIALPIATMTQFTNVEVNLFCKQFQYMFHVAEFAEVYSLVAIAIDRYQVIISHHGNSSFRCKVRSSAGVVLIWIISLLYGIPCPFFYHHTQINLVQDDKIVHFFTCAPDPTMMLTKVVILMNAVVLFLIPLSVIFSAYTFLFLRVKYKEDHSAANNAHSQSKMLKTVVILVGIFVALNLPLLVFNIYVLHAPAIKYEKIVLKLLELTAYLNFGVNAFLYALMTSNFKMIRLMLPRWCCCSKAPQVLPTEPNGEELATRDQVVGTSAPNDTPFASTARTVNEIAVS